MNVKTYASKRPAPSLSIRSDCPFVFVIGCPRSGTTLLQRMLNNHPLLAVANDTHFIPRAIQRLPKNADPVVDRKLADAVWSYHRFKRLGVSQEDFDRAAANATRYSDLVRRLYWQFAKNNKKPLGGEKTPDYCRHIPRLHRLFPRTRFLHIIRDGRDVALSTRDWAHEGKGPGRFDLWQEQPLGVCALWWRWLVSSGRTDGLLLPPGLYHEIAYEDLVDNPRRVLEGAAQFLGLPYSSKMETYHQGKTRANRGLSAKSAWLPPTRGLRDWRNQMERSDIELFEAIAGDLLSQLGYEQVFESFSQKASETAARCKTWWNNSEGKSGQAFSGNPENSSVISGVVAPSS